MFGTNSDLVAAGAYIQLHIFWKNLRKMTAEVKQKLRLRIKAHSLMIKAPYLITLAHSLKK